MATKGFTKIDNSIIFDLDLSLEALGLYIKLKHLATIENFKINRTYIKAISGYGETAFRRVWKELKDKGVLIETKERVQGKFEYTYSLEGGKPSKVKKEIPAVPTDNKIHVDSNGNKILDGQMTIDDITVENDKPVTTENIEAVAENTGLDAEQSKQLLECSNNDVSKVLEAYQYVMHQRGVKSVFSYTKWAIRNSKVHKVTRGSESQKGYFNNYEQRTYDFNKLERALLYGEEYELPA